MFAMIVMTDGRKDCILRSVASMGNLSGLISRRIIHDDSGDCGYREWLRQEFRDWELVVTPGRLGFGGAVRSARRHLREHTTEPFILWTEDDFTFDRSVDLGSVADVLTLHPWLAQMVLRRQAWNEDEKAAGGIVEQHPLDYEDHSCCDAEWLEHRRFWSTNPSVFRRPLLDVEWPEGGASEGHHTSRLLAGGFDGIPAAAARFAFWGRRDDGPWVTHIGHERRGTGY